MNSTLPAADAAEAPPSFDAARRRVVLLSALVLAPALALLLGVLRSAEPIIDHGPWVILAIGLGFVVCEPLVFHIEARNEAVSFSPTDFPLAIGMLMISPLSLVAARVVGSAVLLLTWRRQPPFKFVLNLSAFTAETVVAALLFRLFFSPGDAASPLMWVWLTGSLMVGLMLTGVLIAVAISAFEGDTASRVRREISHSYLFYLPGAVLASAAAVPMLIEPWLGAIFILPMPAVWVVLRSHGSLMHRYSDLSNVFDFSSLVGRFGGLQEIADTAVAEIADQLRAGSVALVAWDREAGDVRAVHGNDAVASLLPDAQRPKTPAGAADARSIDDDHPLAADVERLGLHHGLIVDLATDQETIGTVVVADRQGVSDRFDEHDLSRLQQIADQLGVVLRKAQLHVNIQHAATHDRLTDMPNRPYFEAFLQGQLGAGRPTTSVLLIDLDRFKEVNDTLGHHAGDLLLQQVAERVNACLGDDDLAARFGGDEFAAVIPGAGEHEAGVLAEMISQQLEMPFEIGEASVAIAASIGIAIGPDHGDDPGSLLRRADLAMYDAKRRHSRSSVYDPTMDGNDSVRLAMLGDLRDAIHDQTLDVAYQPKIDLRTGQVSGVEALARWEHPNHGEVSPEVFIGVAEQAGLIEDLTEHILTRSLADIAAWRTAGLELTVAVNLSPLSLVNEDLPRMVARSLEQAGVPPRLLKLEITEQSVIGDTPRTMRIIEQLDQVGVKLSIDDFGTGHSSLANLRRLPIAELKIDRSFVSEMLVEHSDEVIVRSTIDLGHNLGFTVVAEGVETEETRIRLRDMGCDEAQGFGICRPLPAAKFARWLQAQTGIGGPSAAGELAPPSDDIEIIN